MVFSSLSVSEYAFQNVIVTDELLVGVELPHPATTPEMGSKTIAADSKRFLFTQTPPKDTLITGSKIFCLRCFFAWWEN